MDEIVVDGVLRDLRHLRSFAVTVPNKGKDGADLIVRVSLGLHTVSRGCERGAHHLEDENGKPYEEGDYYYKETDLEFIPKARKAIEEGKKVFYNWCSS